MYRLLVVLALELRRGLSQTISNQFDNFNSNLLHMTHSLYVTADDKL